MSRTAWTLLTVGTAIFVGLLAWQGFGAVAATLMAAGWGIGVVALFHLLPLAIDAAAIAVLFERRDPPRSMRNALLARWAGESVNGLLPGGQIGGPILMVRHLSQRGVATIEAAAAVTVSTTMQALSQIVFALAGVALFAAYTAEGSLKDLKTPLLIATVVLSLFVIAFYRAQRLGMFGRILRMTSKAFARRDWSLLATQADAVDAAVGRLYADRAKLAATFGFSLLGWIVGTGEVWLALRFLGHPVGWLDALLLESVGQAIRGAAFAIPGSLGVQEGGYLLLAPLVGLSPTAALALSLAKRVREIVLGVPGIVYLHLSERSWQRRHPAQVRVAD